MAIYAKALNKEDLDAMKSVRSIMDDDVLKMVEYLIKDEEIIKKISDLVLQTMRQQDVRCHLVRPPKIFIRDDYDSNNILGSYYPTGQMISFNRYHLRWDDLKEVMNTLVHELVHHYDASTSIESNKDIEYYDRPREILARRIADELDHEVADMVEAASYKWAVEEYKNIRNLTGRYYNARKCKLKRLVKVYAHSTSTSLSTYTYGK